MGTTKSCWITSTARERGNDFGSANFGACCFTSTQFGLSVRAFVCVKCVVSDSNNLSLFEEPNMKRVKSIAKDRTKFGYPAFGENNDLVGFFGNVNE